MRAGVFFSSVCVCVCMAEVDRESSGLCGIMGDDLQFDILRCLWDRAYRHVQHTQSLGCCFSLQSFMAVGDTCFLCSSGHLLRSAMDCKTTLYEFREVLCLHIRRVWI